MTNSRVQEVVLFTFPEDGCSRVRLSICFFACFDLVVVQVLTSSEGAGLGNGLSLALSGLVVCTFSASSALT